MKKIKMGAIAALLCGSICLSSCMGSFTLSKMVLDVNQTITGNKYVNNLLFWVLGYPCYGIATFADAVLFNTIEFWTGSNPIAAGETKSVKGTNGDYLVTTTENGYQIVKDEDVMDLVYNSEANTWNAVVDGTSTQLIQMNNNGTVTLSNGNTVTLDAAGLMKARLSMNSGVVAAR